MLPRGLSKDPWVPAVTGPLDLGASWPEKKGWPEGKPVPWYGPGRQKKGNGGKEMGSGPDMSFQTPFPNAENENDRKSMPAKCAGNAC